MRWPVEVQRSSTFAVSFHRKDLAPGWPGKALRAVASWPITACKAMTQPYLETASLPTTPGHPRRFRCELDCNAPPDAEQSRCFEYRRGTLRTPEKRLRPPAVQMDLRRNRNTPARSCSSLFPQWRSSVPPRDC